jgi:DNA ligase-associated metallophosphoesterase
MTRSIAVHLRRGKRLICSTARGINSRNDIWCGKMSGIPQNVALVAPDILLDGRLALFHQRERWLAVADLHFGYEISQRAAGGLFPLWGMQAIEQRLLALVDAYDPQTLVVIGDLVHDRSAAGEAQKLITRLNESCQTIVVAGNHDRRIAHAVPLVPSWKSDGFVFHHGHCAIEGSHRIQIIGHHHPAATITDGAGLRLKLPAFVQQDRCWIMPAFSAWAAGSTWRAAEESRVWLCSPQRVFEREQRDPARANA